MVLLINSLRSILEYLVRDDAERAVKELDSKDLRGQPVRVQMGEDVRRLAFLFMSSLTLCT
jgi:hypothetical protein